jgi:hypothetical protein
MDTGRDEAHWSSGSSPEYGGGGLALRPEDCLKESNVTASDAKHGIPQLKVCGYMCQGSGPNGRSNCRKMVLRHVRGAVCPDCMDKCTYLQCAKGCLAFIHVACCDKDEKTWICRDCLVRVSSDSSQSEEECVAPPAVQRIENVNFDDYDQCHLYLRQRFFMCKKKRFTKSGHLNQADYLCAKKCCNASFTVRRDIKTDAWIVPSEAEHKVRTISCVFTSA